MKPKKGRFCMLLLPCLLAVMCGCETEPANSTDVVITPDWVAVSEGQSVEFAASGGYEYRWSLEAGKESWGTLSSTRGSRVTYTSLYTPPAASVDTVQILTVTTTIKGTAGTNEFTAAAEAFITHLKDD